MFVGIVFSCVFGRRFFRHLGDLWAPKVSKKLPNGARMEVKMGPEGTLWEALEPWYLLYGRHMGRSRACSGRQVFSD